MDHISPAVEVCGVLVASPSRGLDHISGGLSGSSPRSVLIKISAIRHRNIVGNRGQVREQRREQKIILKCDPCREEKQMPRFPQRREIEMMMIKAQLRHFPPPPPRPRTRSRGAVVVGAHL